MISKLTSIVHRLKHDFTSEVTVVEKVLEMWRNASIGSVSNTRTDEYLLMITKELGGVSIRLTSSTEPTKFSFHFLNNSFLRLF